MTSCFARNCVSLEIRDLFSYIDTVEMVMDLYLVCCKKGTDSLNVSSVHNPLTTLYELDKLEEKRH